MPAPPVHTWHDGILHKYGLQYINISVCRTVIFKPEGERSDPQSCGYRCLWTRHLKPHTRADIYCLAAVQATIYPSGSISIIIIIIWRSQKYRNTFQCIAPSMTQPLWPKHIVEVSPFFQFQAEVRNYKRLKVELKAELLNWILSHCIGVPKIASECIVLWRVQRPNTHSHLYTIYFFP